MARIDVTELLDDPDFCDEFTYDRRVQGVDGNGRGTMTTSSGLPIIGSVQSASAADVLRRFPDAARPSDFIRVYTTESLISHDEATNRYGDVLNWGGRRYQVMATDSWGNFGVGYVKVLAEMIPIGAT